MESELRDSDAVRTWPEKGGSVAAEKEGDHCLLDTLKRSQPDCPSGDALEISFLVRQIASTKGVLWRRGNRNIPTLTHPQDKAGASISQPQSRSGCHPKTTSNFFFGPREP